MRLRWQTIVCAVLMTGTAQAADTRFSTDVRGGVGWSSNPFGARGQSQAGSSGFYEVAVQPHLVIESSRTTILANGHARLQDYFSNYSNSDAYGADIGIKNQASERLSLNARLSYDNSIVGTSQIGFEDPDAPPLNGEDLGLFGVRARRQVMGANGGFTYRLSSRDSITGSGFYTISRYGGRAGQGDYDAYGGTVGYSRQVSERVRLGAQGTVSYNKYDASLGTTRIYSTQGTFGVQLSEHWTLDGALGASFVKRDFVPGTSTSFSGNGSLCRRGERDQECLNAVRQVMPTGFAGSQNQTVVSVTGSYDLTERTSLNGSLGYTDVGRTVSLPGLIDRYLRVEVGARHRVLERLSLTSSVFYRDFSGSEVNVRSDYGGRVGLSYRLGDNRQ